MRLHTNVGLAKEPAALGGGRGRRWVLDLRSGGGARLAHGVGAVHDGGVGVWWNGCVRVKLSGFWSKEGKRGVYGLLCCCCGCDEGGGGI